MIPIFRKGDMYNAGSYHCVSLMPICIQSPGVHHSLMRWSYTFNTLCSYTVPSMIVVVPWNALSQQAVFVPSSQIVQINQITHCQSRAGHWDKLLGWQPNLSSDRFWDFRNDCVHISRLITIWLTPSLWRKHRVVSITFSCRDIWT